MPLVETAAQAAQRELTRVLDSPGFLRNERLSRFLRFVVELHLQGRAHELKESVIGTEIFGRKPDYNPKDDAIVRTEARRLRALLNEYYLGDGKGDALVIELPRGGYIPFFRQAEAAPEAKRFLRSKNAPRLMIAMATLAVVAAATRWWWIEYRSAPIPLAVLPLVNLNQDSANDYFADGLTGEIIRHLSIIEGLAVRSQTSSFAFKGKPRNVREAGKQLQADYILEGSVLRAGQQLRINAQLIRVRDDFPLWSGRYDRGLTDIFAIQDEIARGVVNSLRLRLGRGRRRYETSVEAYDLYLQGRVLQTTFFGTDNSIVPFEAAVAKDPSFAPAYAALATAHALRSGQFRFDIPDEVSKMRAAAQKAVQLDPLLAEAHDALGVAYARDARWEQSEKSFRRAMELDPGISDFHLNFAEYYLMTLGRIREAIQQLRMVEKADPLSPHVHYWLHDALGKMGRYAEAAAHCEKMEEGFKRACLVQEQLRQGRIHEVIQTLEPEVKSGLARNPWILWALGCAYVGAGRREEAERMASPDSFNPFAQADIFACLADKDRTFAALDRVAAAGPIRIGWSLNGPRFAFLRGDPRLTALRRKVGLPD